MARRIDEQKLRELTMITSYVRYIVRNDFCYRAVTMDGFIDATSYNKLREAIIAYKEEKEAK